MGNFTKLKKILSFFKLFAGIVALANAKDMYVVGGGVVAPHSETYILSLQRFSSHFCGATLITANYGNYKIELFVPTKNASENYSFYCG